MLQVLVAIGRSSGAQPDSVEIVCSAMDLYIYNLAATTEDSHLEKKKKQIKSKNFKLSE